MTGMPSANSATGIGYAGRRAMVAAGLVLIFAPLAVQYFYKARDDRSAFLRWRPQIQDIGRVNIYERYTYPNPPIMALILWPLAQLPPLVGSFAWFATKLLLAGVALNWIVLIIQHRDDPFPAGAQLLALGLSLRPIMGDLSHGNVNLFILFLVTGCLWAFYCRQDFAAGVILALAIACKLTPALLLPYFVWKRAWRLLAGSAVGVALWLVLVPGLFLGMNRNLSLLESWYACMVQPFIEKGLVTTDHTNQSLPGMVYRLLTHSPAAYEGTEPTEYRNIADIDPRWLRLGLKLSMVAFALLVVLTCRTPIDARGGWRLAAEYSIIVLGMLLFSERTWKHHCVTLALPFAVISYYLFVHARGGPVRTLLASALVASALLMAATVGGVGAEATQRAKTAEAWGPYVWLYLILIGTLVTLLRQPKGSSRPGLRWHESLSLRSKTVVPATFGPRALP
jgi:alpha-1,2-mannosyltransferase